LRSFALIQLGSGGCDEAGSLARARRKKFDPCSSKQAGSSFVAVWIRLRRRRRRERAVPPCYSPTGIHDTTCVHGVFKLNKTSLEVELGAGLRLEFRERVTGIRVSRQLGFSVRVRGPRRQFSRASVQLQIRAFQFGQKSFDSILATESIFFDSIRQSDKFAA